VRDAPECSIAQVARRQYASGKVGADATFDFGEISEAHTAVGEMLKSKVDLPDLRKRPSD
jgi:hypothetical protein